ncbi:MAG: pantoate--beta-alanine ligase [Nitrospirae bacterium]|nr:MAG: pantoate--beta-alanine ligase [Nitrospirota bacterium]
MEIIKHPKEMQDLSKSFIKSGKDIGFVPTMGFLHEGHLSIIRRARRENSVLIVSIFVNPIQFGEHEDLDRYPSDIEGDIEKLSSIGCDVLFHPTSSLMYDKRHSFYVDPGQLSEHLCGRYRPGHFRGVATVVAKLFNITKPTRAYFGQKDYQQAIIIRKMVEELNFDVNVVICPTVREPDGLAMSSRNVYLSEEERKRASTLYRALKSGEEMVLSGQSDPNKVKEYMEDMLLSNGISKIDYISIADPETLEDVVEIKRPLLIALAVHIGRARLIDNILIE